ncbi:MAG TPA: TIGR03560 family F420-dependent LLM class oxidoreductase [Candidatus Saccharimonadales bacterium]|nr:TIGR03560 family F420-dependent LLM class oxidoreductase [Candidatus Saccharimonadales bacterium]
MRFVLMTEPQQGMSYADQLAAAKRAEANGFDAFFRSDHFASFPGEPGQPTTDAWSVVAGLARETDRIGLGVLVSPVTFRHPGVLAKVVTTVDEMSGGRIEVGVGAGWNEIEHHQLGLAFPPIKERADLLEDQLAILHGLWGEPDGWSHTGVTGIRVDGALFRPRPVDVPGRPRTPIGGARPRIVVGGQGSPRSFRLAARYADEFNLSSSSPEKAAAVAAELDAACQAIGRDPATLARSVMSGVLIGRSADEVKARETALLEAFGPDEIESSQAWLEERRARWVFGTPDEARAQLERFAAVGLERIMLQDMLPWDLDMIDVMGEELVGRA